MTYLIDSDWVIDFLLGRSAAVALFSELFGGDLAISIVSFTEVYQGIYFGRDPQRTEELFRRFLLKVPILGIDAAIARRAA